MPSFVIHYTSGEILLNKIIKENVKFNELAKSFRTGNLIADSTPEFAKYVSTLSKEQLQDKRINKELYIKKQTEKNKTHFRKKESETSIILVPDLDIFISKYHDLLEQGNPFVLGYLFHLYFDNRFFTLLFPKSFTIYDANNQQTNSWEKGDTKSIYAILAHSKKKVNVDDLFSNMPGSIYYDYTLLNKEILKEYSNIIDTHKVDKHLFYEYDNSIKEVEYTNIEYLVNKMNEYINDSYKVDDTFKVLDKNEVIEILEQIVDEFIVNYKEYIKNTFNNME